MAKIKRSASSELDQLRDQHAAELARVRELEARLDACRAEVEQASGKIKAAYADENPQAAVEARKTEHRAVERVRDAQHRLDGALIRAERAGQRVDAFQAKRAGDLLSEAEAAARETTLNLQRAAQETVRFWRQYKQDREAIQQLVNRVEPGAGQVNGPPATCSWERELHELERALRRGDELGAPLPRWQGRVWRTQEDDVARRLREERREAVA